MDNPPLFFPNAPQFAPRMHVRNASQSPTRKRFSDDILSDLSPATTLEAFTNPSGKLKASIEAASPSERAFGIRATTASKKIQECVYELSNWPWPAEGGSVGFEMPATKRRKLSDPFVDSQGIHTHEQTGMLNGDGLEYIGSLSAEEVDRYETRIEEIQTDMEDLNVEDIKRQVLDNHLSPRSRPSSSASNAPPMPTFLSSYTKMDDFTAVVTSTVLQSLPNLSRLMRLMDVWSIRLIVLRKVPPLLLALDDAEIALKSGWNAIQASTSDEEYLTREAYDIMRNVLRDKVTALGKDLDFLLDTLEGREDTLPDTWLDRMEAIENDYGSWDVASDRKVREGEWAELAERRKVEEDARKLLEAQEAEVARLKAEREARRESERIALQQAADEAKRKAEKEIREAEEAENARLQAIRDAEEAAQLIARMEAETLEAERLEREREAAKLEVERLQAQRDAEITAQIQAERDAQELTRHRDDEEGARLNLQREASRLKALREVEALAIREVEEEARNLAQRQAEEEVTPLASQQVPEQEEKRLKALKDAEDLARCHIKEQDAHLKAQVLKDAEELVTRTLGVVGLSTKQEAKDLITFEADGVALLDTFEMKSQAAKADIASLKAIDDDEEVFQKSKQEVEISEVARQIAQQQIQQLASKSMEREAEDFAIRRSHHAANQAEVPKLEVDEVFTEAADWKAYQEPQEEATNQGPKHFDEQSKMEMHIVEGHRGVQSPQPDVKTLEREAIQSQDETGSAMLKANKEYQSDQKSHFQTRQPSEDSSVETAKQAAVESAITKSCNMPVGDQVAASERTSTDIQASADIEENSQISDESENFPTCTELENVDQTASLKAGARVSMGSATSTPVSTPRSDFSDAVKPSTTSYAPFDGTKEAGHDGRPLTSADIHADEGSGKEVLLDFPIRINKPSQLYDPQPTSPSSSTIDNRDPVTPTSPNIPRFGHAFANALRVSSSPSSSSIGRPQPSGKSQDRSPPSPPTQTHEAAPWVSSLDGARDLLDSSQVLSTKSNDDGWIVITVSDDEDAQASEPSVRAETHTSFVSMSRPASLALGYSAVDRTPEIHQAEPAEYFQPILSPIRSERSLVNGSTPTTPSKSYKRSPRTIIEDAVPTLDGPNSPDSPFLSSPGLAALRAKSLSPSQLERGGDECVSCDEFDLNKETACPASVPVLARNQSLSRINTGLRQISIPRKDSISSETSTLIDRVTVSPSSPIATPITDSPLEPRTQGDKSPSAGRIGHRIKKPYDFTPPGSPQRASRLSPQRSLQILRPSPSPLDLAPVTPIDAPTFESLDVTTTPIISSPKKATTDEQIQQQISSLLESIPARIRLTSEPAGSAFTAQTLRPNKVRRSITPTPRPSSTMSNYSSTSYSRAATPGPQFTLAPAFGKTSHRTRIHNGNPEIKLYHLSRSTGEAPIKLFVRLVGEHGERVMVRVGGGWADLGEYLKEYASHHGRRSASDAGDKVEIQDLPPRIASNSSTTSTVRGNGRDTPVPRPFSVLERERPSSSLNVRKTRKSIGDHQEPSPFPSRIYDTRSPSTPLPITSRRAYETPPSVASAASSTGSNGRSSSRMSWTDEDSSLGLAGPKSKKIVISERDQEWVESMKEKVRLASAEKEKRERGDSDRTASFGEIDKVGGTKRLFRKG